MLTQSNQFSWTPSIFVMTLRIVC